MFGLKFLSESKLFGGCPPCPRTTSVTLISTPILNRAAADQGHAHAQYNLAAAHLNGHDAGLEEV